MSARYNYEDVREILVNCQDCVILSGGINDRKSCLALWDWCVPRIKGIIRSVKSCRNFEGILLKGVRKGEGVCINDSIIKLYKLLDWVVSMYYDDKDTISWGATFHEDCVDLEVDPGWHISQTLNGLMRFHQHYNDIMRSVKDLIAQNQLYTFSKSDGISGGTARDYFQREFIAKGSPFEKVISEMRGMRISDTEILDILNESLSGVVWEE